MTGRWPGGGWTRRGVLRAFGVGISAIGFGASLSGCSDPRLSRGPIDAGTGGAFRVGVRGGSSADVLDPHRIQSDIDTARTINLFDSLGQINPDATMSNQLAQEMVQRTDGMEWTFRLKDGLTFHNGKDVTADDVIATLRGIVDPKKPSPSAPLLSAIDMKGLARVDKLTVRVPMLRPSVILSDTLGQYMTFAVVPEDFDPRKPVGAGPFKLKSFTPGKESVFEPFADYWQGASKIDQLHILNFADEQAQVNAVINGQVDAVAGLTAGSMRLIQAQNEVRLSVEDEAGSWAALTMLTTVKPFDDGRVRAALRLCADREQMRKAVYSGRGTIGNDVPSIWDPMYDRRMAQRTQDLRRSRELLREAGHDRLSLELTVADVFSGAIEQATVFAEQAREGGFDITLKKLDISTFYADYGKWPFSVDWFYYNPYLQQISMSYDSDAGYNTTQWRNARFQELHTEALRTVDRSARERIVHEMVRLENADGPMILSLFAPTIDAVRKNVSGLKRSRTGMSLGCYDFRGVTVGV
ncbi:MULTISPECIES: ABC transporter substrate-binding protein [unclassified Pseudarthrobacter]|uniref:ABC transporter substrate-binding protein n=1 Tax=unclassified Pseudarthrobacter TaxID=2647000 RepID=UPI0030768FEB